MTVPAASVIVRSKDEAASIGETLERLRTQTCAADAEIIVVDSGSTDRTVQIARSAGARIVEIPAAAFTFGGSLNCGCTAASGRLGVALSAHAFPPDDRWLERLLAVFDDDTVACASGDDYGPGGGRLTERVRQDAELLDRHPAWGYSNAAGAFRLDLWRRRAFRPDMPGTEDKEWAAWWLRRGMVHVAGPDLKVEHDHSHDPVREIFDRACRESVGFSMYLELPDRSPRTLARRWWSDLETYTSPLKAHLSHRRAARLLGEYAGQRPAALRRQQRVWAAAADAGRAAGVLERLAPPNTPAAPLRLAVMTDRFPELSERFVTTEIAELRAAGHLVAVEAVMRADRPNWDAAAGVRTAFMTDETLTRRAADLAWLVTRHPRACAADLVARRRWCDEHVTPLRALAPRARRIDRRGIEHLHVHFAQRSALEARRIAALLGRTYSVTAHAVDIFAEPRDLREKLAPAALVTTGCDDDVRHLRELVGPEAADRIGKVVMGVDPHTFRRTVPLPGGRTVLAIGRLVEKKGFDVLVEACALLHRRTPLDAVVLVGEGPQRSALERLARERGVDGLVRFAGALGPAVVRTELERADLLAMPAVVADGGDRDSMPVLVKEAMAMELLVAASDEVGLPEVVIPPWGRLAPPRDAGALADAIEELLALGPDERAAAGLAARVWVSEHACSARETERLVALIRAGTTPGGNPPAIAPASGWEHPCAS